jgi:DNA polymerase-3 subunit delta'
MLFSDIIGQEKIKKRLAETVRKNKTGHAWLLFGPAGSGKLPLAIAFGQYLLCTSRKEDDSCDTCPGCTKNRKLIHPDMHFSFPINKTKRKDRDHQTSDDFLDEWRAFITSNPYGALDEWYSAIDLENRQGLINIDESRLILTRLSYKSFESEYKVAIIWQADKMNGPAANTLLKIIEEPPPNTVFILTAENSDLILPTIRSRCINVKIPGIEKGQLSEALVKLKGLEPGRAANVARIAGGSYSRALKLIGSEESDDPDFLEFRDMLGMAYSKKIKEITELSDKFGLMNRERQKTYLETGLSRLRECFIRNFNDRNCYTFLTPMRKENLTNNLPHLSMVKIL